jgi:hypothetical protein
VLLDLWLLFALVDLLAGQLIIRTWLQAAEWLLSLAQSL